MHAPIWDKGNPVAGMWIGWVVGIGFAAAAVWTWICSRRWREHADARKHRWGPGRRS